MPGLNEIFDAKSTIYGSGKVRQDAYNKLKATHETNTWAAALECRLRPVVSARFVFTWYRPSSDRRDPDNVAGGGQKIILDALIKCGVLTNDGSKQVLGLDHRFVRDDRPGVRVEIMPEHEGRRGPADMSSPPPT